MHSVLKTALFISLGVTSGLAFAGPNWDVINSARAAAQHQTGGSSATPANEVMLARCDEMMKQMDTHPMGSGKNGQPMTSPKGQPDAK